MKLGSLLYHGTCSPDYFDDLEGPAWLTDVLATAKSYALDTCRNDSHDSRVLVFRLKAVPRLVQFPDEEEVASWVAGMTGQEYYDKETLVSLVESAGYDGWIMETLFTTRGGGLDIMLLEPAKWIEYKDEISVPKRRKR